jgi:hypothetical protein
MFNVWVWYYMFPSIAVIVIDYCSMLTQYDELRAARGRTLALEHDTTQELGDYGGHALRTDSSLLSKSGK